MALVGLLKTFFVPSNTYSNLYGLSSKFQVIFPLHIFLLCTFNALTFEHGLTLNLRASIRLEGQRSSVHQVLLAATTR